MQYCSIEQCKNYPHGKGLCSKHYIAKFRTPQKNAFYAMRNRCGNPNHPRYKDYGARGIKVCERWLSSDGYKNFLEDMGERPADMTLDRIDNNGNYEPNNCRWASSSIQSLNKRNYKSNNSGTTGVYMFKKTGKWIANIRVDKINYHIGYFQTKEEA